MRRRRIYYRLTPMTALFAIVTESDAVLGMDCLLCQGEKPIYEWSMKSARLGDKCCIGFQGTSEARDPIFCRYIIKRPDLERTGSPLSVWEAGGENLGLDYAEAKKRLQQGIDEVVRQFIRDDKHEKALFSAILVGEIGGRACGSQWWICDDWKADDHFYDAATDTNPVLGYALMPDKQLHDFDQPDRMAVWGKLLGPETPAECLRNAIRTWAICTSNRKNPTVNDHTVLRSLRGDCRAVWEPDPPEDWPAGDPTLASSSAGPSTDSCT